MTRVSERGSTSVFVLGIALITFAVAGLAVDVTRAWIYKRSLQSRADAMATAAASELNATNYYASGGRTIVIDSDSARMVASRYLTAAPDARAALLVRRDRVVVTLRGAVPSTFLSLIAIHELPVAASSTASPIAGRPPR